VSTEDGLMERTRGRLGRLDGPLAAAVLAIAGCASSGSSATSESTSDTGVESAASDAAEGATQAAAEASVDGGATDAGDGQPGDGEPGDAVADAAVDAGPIVGPFVRFAHFVPDAPALDLCVVPHGSGSPAVSLLQTLALNLADGGVEGGAPAGTPALSYSQVSNYVDLSTRSFGAGAYDLRVLAAGEDCTTGAGAGDAGFAPVNTRVPSLLPGTFYTLAAMGDADRVNPDAMLQVAPFVDDTVLPSTADWSLRFINAAPSAPSLDFDELGEQLPIPVLIDALFGQAASVAIVPVPYAATQNGYLTLSTSWRLSGSSTYPVGAAPSAGSATTSSYSAVGVLPGSLNTGIVTFIGIGGKSSDTTHPPAIEECQDGPVHPQAFLSPCTVLPQ
jgi:hypothetical protein